MLVTGVTPSGGVIWFALSRDSKPGGPPTMPPACALPCSASPSSPPRSKLNCCRFQAVSVKPSRYDQSCIRLCIVNRFDAAASMSLRCGDSKAVGLQPSSNHWLVQAKLKSRVSDSVKFLPVLPVSLVFHFSVACALLPSVRNVGSALRASTSQGNGDAAFWTARTHPGAPEDQHHSSRVSVEE